MSAFDPASVRALVFDVFGTVVDWRSSIIREGEAMSRQTSLPADWSGVADAWRAGYAPAMERARAADGGAAVVVGAAAAWPNLDQLHRQTLDELLPRFGLQSLGEAERAHLTHAWHRLQPWPDALKGLQRLRRHRVVATLSNGNVSLLVDLARHAGLGWDCVLSAELFQRYKPDPAVYLGAARLLGLAPARVLMVAAHPGDLRAARACGLRTAYVPRPLEHGPAGLAEPVREHEFDLVASDFIDLAERLPPGPF